MWDRRHRSWPGTVLRRALAWVLVPVAVFSGQPTMACRCSNGRIKLFCSRLVDGSRRGGEQASGAGYARPCCCCRETLRGYCGSHGDCPEWGGTVGAFAGRAARECCCSPLSRALFAPAKGVGAWVFNATWVFVGVDASQAEAVLACEAMCSRVQGPPPPDLVILHRSLRI